MDLIVKIRANGASDHSTQFNRDRHNASMLTEFYPGFWIWPLYGLECLFSSVVIVQGINQIRIKYRIHTPSHSNCFTALLRLSSWLRLWSVKRANGAWTPTWDPFPGAWNLNSVICGARTPFPHVLFLYFDLHHIFKAHRTWIYETWTILSSFQFFFTSTTLHWCFSLCLSSLQIQLCQEIFSSNSF